MGKRTEKEEKKKEEKQEKKEKRRTERKQKEEARRQYFFVIRELTGREVKRRYARSYLGIIWSVLNPLLTMAVMSLVFSTMFRRSIENYPGYLMTGQIIWGMFSSATNAAMGALVENKNLLLKVKLPKQIFVLAKIYTALVNFGYTCMAYLLMLLFFQVRLTWAALLLPVAVFFILLFSLGLGYMLAIAFVFFADIKYLYSVLLTLWMYLSAIFYPVSNLSSAMQQVVEANPVYVAIAIARDCMLYGKVSEPIMWIRLVLWSIGSFAAGYLFFKKKENKVMQKI